MNNNNGSNSLPLGPLIVDIEGLTLSEIDREILLDPLIGGVIIFSRNFDEPNQLTELVSQIKALRDPQLIVAVDQEGGRVQRLKKGFTTLPALNKIGQQADRDVEMACEIARNLARLNAYELKSNLIDFSFAPVVDLYDANSEIIADRAFHSDANITAKLAVAFMQGLHDIGMIAVAKHFPGHGGVIEDSHLCLPVDNRCIEQIIDNDLIPYKALIDNGLDGVLTAHIKYNHIDKYAPGFSEFWNKTMLRQTYNFKGLIFSDDMSMQGAKEYGTIQQRVIQSLTAGNNMVLICNNRTAVEQVLNDKAIISLAKNRVIDETLFNRKSTLADWQPDRSYFDKLIESLN